MEERKEMEEWITCGHSLRCLIRGGIHSMEKLSTLSYEDLIAMRGIGPVIAGDLMRVAEQWRENGNPSGENKRKCSMDRKDG